MPSSPGSSRSSDSCSSDASACSAMVLTPVQSSVKKLRNDAGGASRYKPMCAVEHASEAQNSVKRLRRKLADAVIGS